MSILDLFQWEHGIDDGFNCSLDHQRQNFLCERGGDGDLLLQRSRAQHGSNYVETFAKDVIEIDLGLTTSDTTDQNEPSFDRHRREAGGEIRTTCQIEHNVKPATASNALAKSCKPR